MRGQNKVFNIVRVYCTELSNKVQINMLNTFITDLKKIVEE